MNRFDRKFRRDAAMDYARRFLNVKRLPAGVPAIVKAYAEETSFWTPMDGLGQQLRAYRKPYWGV
jgi:hypothetical protein